MDYTTKQPDNILRKYQWYVIHNPRLSLFGGAEEEVSEVSYVQDRGIVITGGIDFQNNFWNNALVPLLKRSPYARRLFKIAVDLGTLKRIMLLIYDSDGAKPSVSPHTYGKKVYFLPFNVKLAGIPNKPKDGTGKEGIPSPPEISLAHELFHFIQHLKGLNTSTDLNEWKFDKRKFIIQNKPFYSVNEQWYDNWAFVNEIDAVKAENIVRKQIGLPLRYYYSGEYIFCVAVSSNKKKFYSKEAKGWTFFSYYYLIKKNNKAHVEFKKLLSDLSTNIRVLSTKEFKVWFDSNFIKKYANPTNKNNRSVINKGYQLKSIGIIKK